VLSPKLILHGLKLGTSEDSTDKRICAGLEEAVQLLGALKYWCTGTVLWCPHMTLNVFNCLV